MHPFCASHRMLLHSTLQQRCSMDNGFIHMSRQGAASPSLPDLYSHCMLLMF